MLPKSAAAPSVPHRRLVVAVALEKATGDELARASWPRTIWRPAVEPGQPPCTPAGRRPAPAHDRAGASRGRAGRLAPALVRFVQSGRRAERLVRRPRRIGRVLRPRDGRDAGDRERVPAAGARASRPPRPRPAATGGR